MLDGEEVAECVICQEGLLAETVAALKCGHVYHRSCIAIWFSQSNGTCPQCKKPSRLDDVRTLDFQLVPAPQRSAEEQRRLEAASVEEREQLREAFASEFQEVKAAEERAQEELSELQTLARERKHSRQDLERAGHRDEAEISELCVQVTRAAEGCAALQASLDAQSGRLQRGLPILRPRDDDPDLREERRKLKVVRATERGRQLHEALVSAMQQEGESCTSMRERTTNAEDAEAALKQLRGVESRLRRELSERRDEAEKPSLGLLDTATPVSQEAELPRSMSSIEGEEPSSASTPSAGGAVRRFPTKTSSGSTATPDYVAVEEVTSFRRDSFLAADSAFLIPIDGCDEEADLLYGSVPSRTAPLRAPKVVPWAKSSAAAPESGALKQIQPKLTDISDVSSRALRPPTLKSSFIKQQRQQQQQQQQLQH